MRKSTLFISAVLTTFVLIVLVGVVSAYKKNTTDIAAANTQQDPSAVVADLSTATAAPILTPEEAAALAAQVIGHTDLYSVETSLFNNEPAYLVTFSSSDLVYVSLTGQILSIGKLPTVYVSAPAAPTNNNNDKPKRPRPTQPPTGGGDDGGGDDGGGDDGGDDGDHDGGDDDD